jgi:hypothetical protein
MLSGCYRLSMDSRFRGNDGFEGANNYSQYTTM